MMASEGISGIIENLERENERLKADNAKLREIVAKCQEIIDEHKARQGR